MLRSWHDDHHRALVATCTGCGATVFWKRHHATDKAAPVNPDVDPTGNVVLDGDHYRVLTKKEIAALDTPTLLDMGDPEVRRYTLHFATCPASNQFRRCNKCHHTPCECSTVAK